MTKSLRCRAATLKLAATKFAAKTPSQEQARLQRRNMGKCINQTEIQIKKDKERRRQRETERETEAESERERERERERENDIKRHRNRHTDRD